MMLTVTRRVGAAVHYLTWACLMQTAAAAAALLLLNATAAPLALSRLTPALADGQHEAASSAGNAPFLLFFLAVGACGSALLIAAGGLRRVTR